MTKIFSLKGKGLKFDTTADVEIYLRDLAAMPDVEAIDISGNTWGIDAVKPFAEVLKGCKSIKVCPTHQFQPIETNDPPDDQPLRYVHYQEGVGASSIAASHT